MPGEEWKVFLIVGALEMPVLMDDRLCVDRTDGVLADTKLTTIMELLDPLMRAIT